MAKIALGKHFHLHLFLIFNLKKKATVPEKLQERGKQKVQSKHTFLTHLPSISLCLSALNDYMALLGKYKVFLSYT